MNRSIRLLGWVITLSLVLAGGTVFAQATAPAPGQPITTPKPDQRCCIAGEYKGHHKDIASKTCPKPEEGDFKMIIYQDRGCGSKIWGKIINPDGSTQEFTGIVTVGTGGCCNISGGWSKPPAVAGGPGERTDFKGILCKKGGKWTGKGSYRNTRGTIVCNGDWNMTQM